MFQTAYVCTLVSGWLYKTRQYVVVNAAANKIYHSQNSTSLLMVIRYTCTACITYIAANQPETFVSDYHVDWELLHQIMKQYSIIYIPHHNSYDITALHTPGQQMTISHVHYLLYLSTCVKVTGDLSCAHLTNGSMYSCNFTKCLVTCSQLQEMISAPLLHCWCPYTLVVG